MGSDKAIPVERVAIDATTIPNRQIDHACLHVKSSPHKANASTLTMGPAAVTVLEIAKEKNLITSA